MLILYKKKGIRMKIKVLRVKNFKKIKELVIEPKDNVIVIAGENASGKTSALDAIEWVLGGEGSGKKKITEPVRKGQGKAEVVMEIDNFVVRKYCKDNRISHLTVTNEDETIQYKSPQTMLDSFVGKLSFDPREFMMFSPKEQRDLLLEAFGLKEKLDEIDEKREQIYNERTVINREIKIYEGQLKGLEKPEKDLSKKTISISDLSKRLEDAKDYNNELERDEYNLKETQKIIEHYKTKIEELKTLLCKEEGKLFDMGDNLIGKSPKDLDTLRTAIEEAENVNEKVREAEKYIQIEKYKIEKESESKKLTKEIANLDNSKLKLLKEKKIPFKNLTIEEEGIKLQDIPFNQIADSERLKISIKMAMILNPKLKVIRITDANLFDDRNMSIIKEMADKFKYQIWMERIAVDEFADIVLVDGEIKNKF